jgi:branched-chain amino acid transport system ATP-binding protein
VGGDGCENVLSIEGLTVRFGGIVALDGASLDVTRGQICGLIGPNGAGKTTLFNCINGLYTPSAGRMTYDGRDLSELDPHEVVRIGIARTFQNVGLFPTMTVRDNVLVGAHHRTRASFVTAPVRLPAVVREEAQARDEVDGLLDRLGLTAVTDRRAHGLPLGTLKRVELARALASRPELLLLDEPANGLSHAEVGALEKLIRRLRDEFDLTILVVEHHMAFVMSISNKVVCLNFGRDIAAGTPADIRRNPAVIAAYLGSDA